MTVFNTLLAAGVVIGITGCGDSKKSAVGTNETLAAVQIGKDADPGGRWEADVADEGSQRIRIILDLEKNANAEWIASMGIPSANKTGMVVQDVVVDGKSVKFIAVELMMTPFDLTLGSDGTMKGTISGPRAQPVEFKRTGEAKVELIAASPAVSKELEGDWEGTLESPGGTFTLAFHFKNQPDNTVAATIDSRNANRNINAVRMPLNNVKQIGQKVEFGIKIAGDARFEGILNKEGTELAGQLIHDVSGVPLMLRKK